MRPPLRALLVFGPAAAWVGTAALLAAAAVGRTAPARPAGGGRGPGACARCHPDEVASWRRSYHRTMTQAVGPSAARIVRAAASPGPADRVLAPFAGEHLDALGFRATMTRTAAGIPHVRIERLDGSGRVLLDADVALAVGSHRYQQYVVVHDGPAGPVGLRLPVAFDPDRGAWLHLDAAFLEPDGQVGSEADYLRHASVYNDNCLFCHNTAPVPGRTAAGGFRSRADHLGITCEACHGPAGAHLAHVADPFGRLVRPWVGPDGGTGLFVPDEAAGRRGTDVCGRCHGQRIAADIGQVLARGDGFVPGGDLSDVSRPILRDSALAGRPAISFADRFWSDGTPRLSAYEYQGVLLSACAADPSFGCATCHTMHGGDPAGQVRSGVRDGAVCRGCHAPTAPGCMGADGPHADRATCLDCHMPATTYGLFRTMRTHRVVRPVTTAAADARGPGRPAACLACHDDATTADLRRWGDPAAGGAVAEACGRRAPWLACLARGGDPIERAVAVGFLEGGRAPEADATLAAVLDDPYPAIRAMAARALRRRLRARGDRTATALLASFDPMADPAARAPIVTALRQRLGPDALASDAPAEAALAELCGRASIWIGE